MSFALLSFALLSGYRLIVFDDDVKKDMAPVFSCFVRYAKRVFQRLVISRRTPQHAHREQYNVASSSTCRRCPLQKEFLSAGKLTDTATGIAVDEKQLICWARTNRPKKMKKTDMSVSKLKQQVARSENDARFPAADKNCVASIRLRLTLRLRLIYLGRIAEKVKYITYLGCAPARREGSRTENWKILEE